MRFGEFPIGLESFISEICTRLSFLQHWRFLSFDYGEFGLQNRILLRAYKGNNMLYWEEIEHNLGIFFQHSDLTYDVDFALIERIFSSHSTHFFKSPP